MNSEEENRIAGVALGKTIVVLFYSILIPILLLPVSFWLSEQELSETAETIVALLLHLLPLVVLVYFVVKGWLPGSKIEVQFPFSEKRLVMAVTILSVLGYLLSLVFSYFVYISVVGNGLLVIAVLVFFINKSFIAKKVRVGVLSALIAPGLQIVLKLVY